MEKRILGRTGLAMSVVGLGGAPMLRQTADQSTVEELKATVWQALEGGINWIDTAPAYGSEQVIGQALRERPDLAKGVILSTKTGKGRREGRDYSYDGTLAYVTESLNLLGVDYLDIVHLHDVYSAELMQNILDQRAAFAALQRLQSEGVIGYIGLGTRDMPALRTAIASGGIDIILTHNEYNLLDQPAQPIIASALQRNMGVLVAGVFATGILAKGSADPNARYAYEPAGESTRQRTAAIEAICARWGVSLQAAAIQFCLRGPASEAVALLGARKPEQVKNLLAWAAEAIPAGFWDELDAHIAQQTGEWEARTELPAAPSVVL